MRTQTYLFLQKLKCPKCGRILAGGATHKVKNDKWYFYYRCEDCKNNIKENKIEEAIMHILNDVFEYDSVVNEFFLPVLKNKLENPKDELEEEIKKLNNKKKRLKEGFVNELFTTEEFKDETEKLDKSKIHDLKNTLEYWKNKFEKLISFLHSKLHSLYDKDDKYIDVVNEMYDDNVLDDDDIEELYLNKEKDDFER